MLSSPLLRVPTTHPPPLLHHSLATNRLSLLTLQSGHQWRWQSQPLLRQPDHTTARATASAYGPDEAPIDEEFLSNYTFRDEKTEDEARRRNWIDRDWAPWEEILTPEGQFARTSLNEGEEVPLKTPEALEAFRMLSPAYRRKKMEEAGMSEDDWIKEQFRIKGEIPEPLETVWDGPLVLRMVPPRDWPPRGWKVDEKELAFIREAHRMQSERVDVHGEVRTDTDSIALERYKVFLKQYKEWVAANRDRLEEESYKLDQDYYPGRRKRGKDYNEDMLELPFFYPGQICVGKVTTLHLHQGAFVDIGCVHDGWVPIKGNDWYWIRHHIKIEMPVIVEVLAKRDPYRFRFPIEMRFVNPNIDHLIFNKFEFPPIFHRKEDTNPEEFWRSAGRLPIPRKRPPEKLEEESLLSNHPYVDGLWQLHNAEQMILDDEEANPDKHKSKEYIEAMLNVDYDEEDSIEYTQAYYKQSLIPKVILKINPKDLNMDAAREERQLIRKLMKEAADRGEEYKMEKMRRNIEMDEYDFMHWRRSVEEREALLRDISCRTTLGLPLEEPGRYIGDDIIDKGKYDPTNPLYRYDYWGEPKNSENSRKERSAETHNKFIIGNGTLWYEMSYEEAIKQQARRNARMKQMHTDTEKEKDGDEDDNDGGDDDDDDDDFDFSIFGYSDHDSSEPHVNGAESPSVSDEGMFED